MEKGHKMQEMDTFWSKTGPNMEKEHEMQEMGHFLFQDWSYHGKRA
jgi:hypothetical protein